MWGRWVLDLSDPALLRLCYWRGERLRRRGEAAVPDGAIDSSGVVREPEAVGAALQRLLQTCRPRPRAAWVVLCPAAAVELSVQVPRLWPWQQQVAAESAVRRLLPLNPATTRLRLRRRGRNVQVSAVLQEALAGAVAAARAAGLRVAGVETAAGVLARYAGNHVAVQVTGHHIAVVAARGGLPVYSGCTERDPQGDLAPQILAALESAREEAGDSAVPSTGPLAVVGGDTGDALLAALKAAGWQPYRPAGACLPAGSRHPPPLDLLGQPRPHAPAAAGLAAAAGAAIFLCYLVLLHQVYLPVLASARARLDHVRSQVAGVQASSARLHSLVAQREQWLQGLTAIQVQHRGELWVALVDRLRTTASAAAAEVESVTLSPETSGNTTSVQITARSAALSGAQRLQEELNGRPPLGTVRLQTLQQGSQGVTFVLQAELSG